MKRHVRDDLSTRQRQNVNVSRPVDEYVEKSNALALLIVEGKERPYDVGLRFSAFGVDAASDSWETGFSIIQIWGALTDMIDAPAGWGGSGEPDKERRASALMIRAAKEWLVVSSSASARQAYCDRWKYDELGFQQPGENIK
jgi:hypothetical protein